MKIKKIGSLCKATNIITIYEGATPYAQNVRYISTGRAAYDISGMSEEICAEDFRQIFEINDKDCALTNGVDINALELDVERDNPAILCPMGITLFGHEYAIILPEAGDPLLIPAETLEPLADRGISYYVLGPGKVIAMAGMETIAVIWRCIPPKSLQEDQDVGTALSWLNNCRINKGEE